MHRGRWSSRGAGDRSVGWDEEAPTKGVSIEAMQCLNQSSRCAAESDDRSGRGRRRFGRARDGLDELAMGERSRTELGSMLCGCRRKMQMRMAADHRSLVLVPECAKFQFQGCKVQSGKRTDRRTGAGSGRWRSGCLGVGAGAQGGGWVFVGTEDR